MELGDLLILALILLSVWTFVPRRFRDALRTGLGPSVDALSESLRAGVRVCGRAVQYAAYRWLLGVDVPGSVKGPEHPPHTIMSREEDTDPPFAPSPLETDGRRTETAAPAPKFTEDQLLTLYAGLRAHGMKRDAASQMLKASGIPMNNNIWARSAPPPQGTPADEDDTLLTPIAGRRTRASFYPEESDLEFQPPPR